MVEPTVQKEELTCGKTESSTAKTAACMLPQNASETSEISSMSQVRASHILIKHSGSRNPVSKRTGHHIDISKDQAMAELKEIQKTISKENFAEIAKKRSDCGSFAAGGDLGLFGRGQMQRPFEEASFGLAVGQISNIVDTDSGLHLIYRTA